MRKTAVSLPAEPGSLWPNTFIRLWTFIFFLKDIIRAVKKAWVLSQMVVDSGGWPYYKGNFISLSFGFFDCEKYIRQPCWSFFAEIIITVSSDKAERINPCASPSIIACLPNDTILRECWSCWLTSHEEQSAWCRFLSAPILGMLQERTDSKWLSAGMILLACG